MYTCCTYCFLYSGCRHRAVFSDKPEEIEIIGKVFELENKTIIEENFEECDPFFIVDESRIEPISMIFVFLPDDSKRNYDEVKKMSHSTFAIPSQCIVKFRQQRSPHQFCSNIALKVNTKLSNKSNKARAWNTSHGVIEGLPWMHEAPTLVLGFAISQELGQGIRSVLVGHVALDRDCMQLAPHTSVLQSKSGIIPNDIFEEMTKTLLQHFFSHTGEYPVRVVVYRDGVSEGDFIHVLENECKVLRKVCCQNIPINKRTYSGECNNKCQGKGCIFCCPPITFIVCQTQHNIRVVPKMHTGLKHKNVYSGTCLDQEILDVKDSLLIATKDVPRDPVLCFEDPREAGYDFLLTSQGGLKGTSKPVMYRVLLNENAVWKPHNCGGSALTKTKLQLCTFHMAFQYGTATKAVRIPPVVKYSQRLAGMMMGYISLMIGDGEIVLDRRRDVPTYVTTALNKNNLPNNILHKLSPYDYKLGESRPPAFPHNSA